MAFAATTVFVTLAVVQPAEARRGRGNTYGVMGADSMTIFSQFKLFDTDESGNIILDTVPDDTAVGLFRGAIVDYVIGNGELPIAEGMLTDVNFDSNDNLRLKMPFEQTTEVFAVGNLLAELITDITPTVNKTFVRYSIFEEGSTSTKPFSNFILDPEEPSGIFTTLPDPINLYLAVNDLSYILDNNLLDAARKPGEEINGKNILLDDQDDKEMGLGMNSFLVKTEVINPQAVPESDNNSAIFFAFTSFGAYILLKRQIKMNRTAKM